MLYAVSEQALRPDFPPLDQALTDPDGLLAIGGDLEPERLLAAYRRGIFPWYSDGNPILWWSPDPRTILIPERLRLSRSLRKTLRRGTFTVTLDTAFDEVIDACAAPRPTQNGTWITREMRQAYCRLHELGFAHSVEAWQHGQLVGGAYGVAIGRVFFGESMFTRATDASKVAFVHLVQQLQAWDFGLIDCQLHTDHLSSLGAEVITRTDFIEQIESLIHVGHRHGAWRLEEQLA